MTSSVSDTAPSMPTPAAEPPPDIATSSDAYAARFAGPAGEWMLRMQNSALLNLLMPVTASSVLDVGGGHAQLAVPMLNVGFKVTVLGSTPACAARLAPRRDDPNLSFVAGDILNLPFPDRSFDAVVSVRLVTHCSQWLRLVSEMCRVSRRCVIIDYPLNGGFNALKPWLFKAKKKVELNTREWRNFTHAEIAEAFRANGYSPAGRRAQFMLPMVLHRKIGLPSVSEPMETALRYTGLANWIGSPVVARFDRTA